MKPRHTAALLTLLLFGMGAMPVAQAEDKIYRTTEADGTVVFTDQPAPDSIVVDPGPISVISPDTPASTRPDTTNEDETVPDETAGEPRLDDVDSSAVGSSQEPEAGTTAPALASDATPADDESGRIDSVVIASPPVDGTLLDPIGPLLVEIGTAPGSLAASGLTAELLFDGDIVASGVTSQLATPELLRGSHEIQVRLVNAKGRVVVKSAPQALHVRRTTVRSASGN